MEATDRVFGEFFDRADKNTPTDYNVGDSVFLQNYGICEWVTITSISEPYLYAMLIMRHPYTYLRDNGEEGYHFLPHDAQMREIQKKAEKEYEQANRLRWVIEIPRTKVMWLEINISWEQWVKQQSQELQDFIKLYGF